MKVMFIRRIERQQILLVARSRPDFADLPGAFDRPAGARIRAGDDTQDPRHVAAPRVNPDRRERQAICSSRDVQRASVGPHSATFAATRKRYQKPCSR